jgi:hypothetical protein
MVDKIEKTQKKQQHLKKVIKKELENILVGSDT